MESIFPVRASVVYRFMFHIGYLDIDKLGRTPGVFPFRHIQCSYSGGHRFRLYIAHIYVTSPEETIFEVLLPRQQMENPHHPASYTPGLLVVPTSIVPMQVDGNTPPPARHRTLTDTMKHVDFIIIRARCHAILHCHFHETHE